MPNDTINQKNIKNDQAKSWIEMSRFFLSKFVESPEQTQAPSLNETLYQRKVVKESKIALPPETFSQKGKKALMLFSKWWDMTSQKIDLWFYQRKVAKIALPKKTFFQKGEALLKRFTNWWEWMDRASMQIDLWFERRRVKNKQKAAPVKLCREIDTTVDTVDVSDKSKTYTESIKQSDARVYKGLQAFMRVARSNWEKNDDHLSVAAQDMQDVPQSRDPGYVFVPLNTYVAVMFARQKKAIAEFNATCSYSEKRVSQRY